MVKGLAEVVCMMSSAAYQAKKRSNNVQLAEETVAHRQAHALKRVWIGNQNTAGISTDDEDLWGNIFAILFSLVFWLFLEARNVSLDKWILFWLGSC